MDFYFSVIFLIIYLILCSIAFHIGYAKSHKVEYMKKKLINEIFQDDEKKQSKGEWLNDSKNRCSNIKLSGSSEKR